MTKQRTIISAPGKVLLAGGYLVLDRKYQGLVVATSSRFYSCVSGPSSSSSSSSSTPRSSRISIRAGQFPASDSIWTYDVLCKDGRVGLDQLEGGGGKNKFVAITLEATLQYAFEVLERECGMEEADDELLRRIDGMEVVVLADNDFYSQREQLSKSDLPPRISSLSKLTPFHPIPTPIHKTNKTGLGSSAALVTSLISSILSHLHLLDLSSPESLDQIHTLAQYAHFLAQGKVGSGFDIASAVYGTHIYRRFSPDLLLPLLNHNAASSTRPRLLDHLNPTKWDHGNRPFRLPTGLRLLLADVDAGTDTPGFVGKVLEWRKRESKVAEELWDELDRANTGLEEALEGFAGYTVGDMEVLAQTPISEADQSTSIGKSALRIHTSLNDIRLLLREMSSLSQVPIEPPEQTRLLDACTSCPGVFGGGVPGAGGYDALFLLIVDTPDVIGRVEGVWEGWRELLVCPLLAGQSDGGLRIELGDVKGLNEALRSEALRRA